MAVAESGVPHSAERDREATAVARAAGSLTQWATDPFG